MLLDHDPKKELDTEHPFRRDGLLRQCYEQACDFAVQMWVRDESVIRFEDKINEIGRACAPRKDGGPAGMMAMILRSMVQP
ncbi:uncharacterized protein N7483_004063 [Penicillium malachiteum]|uniref:uncharacterized protein n=1 Tax=Penicillium malachiteum TaxID=1324776 RepID=UPI00254766DA|nr:uncharacterized protein N7483_004063 [Penicillium malachiteum]KAJ5729555.1 hypothetical protein N7483_004063 [Penicillium malachiteum]